jgi:hypothetical protein
VLIIAAGWYLVARHTKSIAVFAALMIPFGAIALTPLVTSLRIFVVIVFLIRWGVLSLRQQKPEEAAQPLQPDL